jgi:ankyrin repeat protein
MLLARGADVNVRSKQGQTPLIIAASGNSESVRLLVGKESSRVNYRVDLFIRVPSRDSNSANNLTIQICQAEMDSPLRYGTRGL